MLLNDECANIERSISGLVTAYYHRFTMTKNQHADNNPGTRTTAIAPLRIGFILREHFSMVTFTAAVDTLVTANLITPSPMFKHFTIGADNKGVMSDLGIEVSTSQSLAEFQNDASRVDLLLVCGGYRSQLQPEALLLETLRQADHKKTRLGGLWNGGLALIQAGLMNQHRCALHPDNHAYAQEHFPDVTLSKNAYEIDDQRATCAGPVSALEMMLKQIGRMVNNQNLVRAIREILSCDQVAEQAEPMPLNLGDDPSLPETLQTLLALMRSNIEEPLTLPELAQCADLSRRQVERLFQAHLDKSPSRYYLEIRLNHARRLVFQTSRSVLDISLACGFISSSHFTNCYKDYFGMPPTEARRSRQSGSAS